MQLLELQALDDRTARLRAEAAAIESRQRSDPAVERTRTALAEVESRLGDAGRAVEAAERDAEVLRRRVKELDRQLYGGSVRNPQDLLTLQRELEEVRTHLGEVEDAELATMESHEATGREREAAAEALRVAEEGRAAAAGPEAARLATIREDLALAEGERERLVAALPDGEVRLYERLVARRQPAVVRLSGDACGGCRLPLGMREVHEARIGHLVQCPSCDRIAAP